MTEVMKANPFQLGLVAPNLVLGDLSIGCKCRVGRKVGTPNNANQRPKLLNCKVRQGPFPCVIWISPSVMAIPKKSSIFTGGPH